METPKIRLFHPHQSTGEYEIFAVISKIVSSFPNAVHRKFFYNL